LSGFGEDFCESKMLHKKIPNIESDKLRKFCKRFSVKWMKPGNKRVRVMMMTMFRAWIGAAARWMSAGTALALSLTISVPVRNLKKLAYL